MKRQCNILTSTPKSQFLTIKASHHINMRACCTKQKKNKHQSIRKQRRMLSSSRLHHPLQWTQLYSLSSRFALLSFPNSPFSPLLRPSNNPSLKLHSITNPKVHAMGKTTLSPKETDFASSMSHITPQISYFNCNILWVFCFFWIVFFFFVRMILRRCWFAVWVTVKNSGVSRPKTSSEE